MKIIKIFIISILLYLSINITNGTEFLVKSGLDADYAVQLLGTGSKIGDSGYFLRSGNYYDEAGNSLGAIPGGASLPADYNDRKKTVIDTQYYWYLITSENFSSSDSKQFVVVNKQTGEIYSKRFTGEFYSNYTGSSYIPFFFFQGNLMLKLGPSHEWYYFDKGNIEFNIEPGIKTYSGYTTSLTISGKEHYYADEYGSNIYTIYTDTFRGYEYAYDGNGNILRAYSDILIQNNFEYNRFQIHKSNAGIFYLSFVNTTTSEVWMRGYNTNTGEWIEYPGKYMLFYNPLVGYGWTVGDYGIIPYYISETGRIASIGIWVESLGKYVKYYQKTDNSLYTNDVLGSDEEGDGSSTGTGTDDTIGDGTSTGIIDDNSSIIDSLFSLFSIGEDKINNLQNSLSGALDIGSSGFSIGSGGLSQIDFIPGNNDYGTIIGRNEEKGTCDMFNTDGSFAYYSNGSYDLTINLSNILNLGYADKIPFLEELLYIPNKILSFITNPLQNIFSTLRVFGGIGENTYCYFGTLQTIQFQKHIMLGASFFGGEFIFTPGTLTVIDYLILFFMGIPLLILTVKILLY